MKVYERQPYSGQLVFAAFSGSHQDAIAKGMKLRENDTCSTWTVPYLPIDPSDVGRVYEADVIRINSQSGKGGIGYILETQFKLNLPPKMREVFGYHIKSVSDREHRELLPQEVYDIFLRDFVNLDSGLNVLKTEFGTKTDGFVNGLVTASYQGKEYTLRVQGNGGLNCVSSAIKKITGKEYRVESYFEHALTQRSNSTAASYVSVS